MTSNSCFSVRRFGVFLFVNQPKSHSNFSAMAVIVDLDEENVNSHFLFSNSISSELRMFLNFWYTWSRDAIPFLVSLFPFLWLWWGGFWYPITVWSFRRSMEGFYLSSVQMYGEGECIHCLIFMCKCSILPFVPFHNEFHNVQLCYLQWHISAEGGFQI